MRASIDTLAGSYLCRVTPAASYFLHDGATATPNAADEVRLLRSLVERIERGEVVLPAEPHDALVRVLEDAIDLHAVRAALRAGCRALGEAQGFISSMGIYGEVPGERYRSVLDPYRDSAAIIEASNLDYTILRNRSRPS